ncbi:MAG: DUF1501 domain-containing protein [Planctomycetota bacterium]|nr:DUF1501 domain-containing protein [Planctomycetota bacterium]
MLTLASESHDRDCAGLSRRDFLTVGSLALGGLTLSSLLSSRARAAAEGSVASERSVVLLFLGGGPSHIETFDPKMDAPSEIRSVTGEVPTAIPGVTFGGTFPRLARLAGRLAVVRSFRHPVTDHSRAIHHVITAGHPTGASMGSLYARLRGATHPRTGFPTYATITNDEVDGQYLKEKRRVVMASGPGSLGAPLAPFDLAPLDPAPSDSGGGGAGLDLELNVPPGRLADRRALLRGLDRLERRIDANGVMEGVDRFEQQAFDLILGGARKAFDLSEERPELVDRYDTSRFRVGHKKFRPSTLGRQLLLARRLCERGCGFVTVQSAGWDMHADGNNPGVLDGMRMLGPALDRAVSAFLEDLESRGLEDRILLVITGDFGRTPRINKRGGRDHWSSLSTLVLAGGGLRTGQVVGRSARRADVPTTEPVKPENLLATILHVLFDVGRLRVRQGLPAEIRRTVESARPIDELI